jgi:CubicO group peptidase (beta-lactamase class C family)
MRLAAAIAYGLTIVAGVLSVKLTPAAPVNANPATLIAPRIPHNTQIDALFTQRDKPASPGCAIAVIKNSKVQYKRGYGMADLDHDVPITPQTVFHVSSISKQFTATAVLMLMHDGKLALDDPVRKYVPEVPEFGTPITLRELAHHTSGLRDQ